jgi:hypothetical protein
VYRSMPLIISLDIGCTLVSSKPEMVSVFVGSRISQSIIES